ncbi:hypothetical protein [Flammeovirga pacifica]|nr:hypothetical protein [Flammeovirga pacifica]
MLFIIILLCIYYYLNYQKIHWVEYVIEMDENTISVNGEVHKFSDLDLFEFRKQSIMSGDRSPLFIKFSNSKFLFHPPKKSKLVQENYDDFLNSFKEIIKNKTLLNKEKVLSKYAVMGFGVFTLCFFVVIIYMTVAYGKQVLRNLMPPFFICVSVFGSLAGIRMIQLQNMKTVRKK